MSLLSIISLQGTLFTLLLIGALLKKIGLVDEDGKRVLTDLCVNVVIPCNIFKSCLMEFNLEIFRTCGVLLLGAVLMQLICLALNKFLFNRYPPQQKKVLQYSTIVPMSGFLGIPIAEGLFDSTGVLYTAIFLIPMRVIMWSVGTNYFVADAHTDRKQVIKNILTHPCLVAVYLGLFFMITQLQLPVFVTETVRHISGCTTALSMFIVGTILTDVKLISIVNRHTLFFSLIRLILLPVIMYGVGFALGLDKAALGVSVLMTGMPAGATTAIFASRYHSDAPFATKCVVMTTLVSMLTLPLWCWVVG